MLDAATHTDRLEYLDRDDIPQRVRHRLVRGLHRFNRVLMSYRRFLVVLQPVIEAVSLREQRPARVLELGSGSGAFALALARLATRRRLPVEITGSDVVDRYIDAANLEAGRRGLPVRFRQINAFDMAQAVTPGDFDVVFIAQSTHHFSPGQVAQMLAQARGIYAHRFVSIDGQRNWWSMAFAPVAGALVTRDRRLVHDASISTRRFYADGELRVLARMAAPQAQVEVRPLEPGFTVLDVRF
jgi:2-polyprenyl-3-methyl-5-hydroxy-6-metoxy-1,4-benzoquinol methylase